MVGAGVVIFSTGPVLIGAAEASGPVMSFWRLWFGVPILGAVAWIGVRMGAKRPALRAWRWALWAGLAFGVHQLLFFSALRVAGVTNVVLMNVLSPVVVAIAAVPLFGERTSLRFRGWSMLGMGGAAIVVAGGVVGPEGSPAGMAMAGANVLLFAVFFLLSKLAREHIDVLPFLFGTMLVAAVTVTAWCGLMGVPVDSAVPRDLVIALVVAAVPGAIGHFVMTWPLRWVPANVPPVMRLAHPVLSGAMAWLFLAEPITGAHLGGGALTLLGVFGAVRSRPPSAPG